MESVINDERLVLIQAGTGLLSSSRESSIGTFSGLAFTTFLGLHLGNTFFAHSGPHGYDGVMEVLRQFYQVLPAIIMMR